MASSTKAVGQTLLELAGHPIGNDELLARLRDRHPEESLRNIVQAAMYTVTDPAPLRTSERERLYDFALSVRRAVGMS